MKIYTYYENINYHLQDELLEIWKKSWEKYRFEPIVLSRQDAQRSVLYNRYYDFIQRVHVKSVGKSLPESSYYLAAQLEIVAFHTIEQPSYISDYDMINNGFYTGENIESMVHWRNWDCSCFASGDKNGWQKYILFLFEQEQVIIDWCKNEEAKTGRNSFHDQDFLIAVSKIGIDQEIYKMSRDINIIGANYIPNTLNSCKVPHLSHSNMGQIKKQYTEYANYSGDEIRIIMANQIIQEMYR